MSTPSTSSTNANIPGATPLVDANGQITMVWYRFLLALFNRTGGSGTPPDITGLQQQVDAQDVEINSFVPVQPKPAQGTEPFVAIPPPSNAITYRPISNIFRSVESKLRDSVSVKDFGAKGDGVTDDTAAFTAALNTCQAIYAPAGNYIIAGTILVNLSFHRLVGDGPLVTVLTGTSANLPVISVPHVNMDAIEFHDFSINRTVTATVGGDGLQFQNVGDHALISNVLVQRCYIGFSLGPMGFGTVENCRAEFNQNDGFRQTAPAAPSQWNFNNCLSQMNGGNGYAVVVTGAGSVSMGTYTNINSFANDGCGFSAVGTAACPIFGIRIIGGFLGQDGNHEVLLDTYGSEHLINGTFTELAGTASTGPTLITSGGTPPTNLGSGFFATANNNDVHYNNVFSTTHSKNGLTSLSAKTVVTGGAFVCNGIGGDASNQFGILKLGAIMIVTGGSCSNVPGSAFQTFGIAATDGTNLSVTGVDLTGNLTNSITISTNANLASLVGNTGGNTIIPVGSVVIGQASGGGLGTGTLNVASGVSLNNVPYPIGPSATPTSYTPTLTATAGTFTTASATGVYYVVGKLIYFEITATITTVGTATGNPLVTLPFATNSTAGVTAFSGTERLATGKTLQGFAAANSSTMTIRNFDGTTAIVAGSVLVMSGCYSSN